MMFETNKIISTLIHKIKVFFHTLLPEEYGILLNLDNKKYLFKKEKEK